jgi:Fic family protein
MPLLIQLALAHYQFEVIHPFLDGNGRIGRLMIPLMLILRGALTQPLLYLSAFFEQYRDDYFDLLLGTSQNGDLLPWVRFFLRGVQQQARDAEERTVMLVDLHHQVRNELLAEKRPNSVVRLAEQLFSLPFVTAKWAADALDVSPPTAYAAINTLVERGDLVELGQRSRNRIYQAPHIFEAVYGTPPPEDTAG